MRKRLKSSSSPRRVEGMNPKKAGIDLWWLSPLKLTLSIPIYENSGILFINVYKRTEFYLNIERSDIIVV